MFGFCGSIIRRMSTSGVNVSPVGKKGSAVFNKLKVGPMKRLYQYYTPTAVNLAGGVPMDSIFPIDKVQVTTTQGTEFSLEKNSGTLLLNYQRGDGIPGMKTWIQSHVSELHHRDTLHFSSCMTVGSTDAFAKILTLLHGDCVLFDRHAYGAAVAASNALGRTQIGVATDEEGMIAVDLRRQTLAARAQGLIPDVVYLVPVAQNPTGVTMSIKRKEEIYQVCKELDLIVVEDGDILFFIFFVCYCYWSCDNYLMCSNVQMHIITFTLVTNPNYLESPISPSDFL